MAVTQMERDAEQVLRILAARGEERLGGKQLADESGLPPDRLNDAVDMLVGSGHAEVMRTLGTRPYNFYIVNSTSRGRYEVQRIEAAEAAVDEVVAAGLAEKNGLLQLLSGAALRPPSPVGSPYGFQDGDWEMVAQRKGEADHLYVVLGHQSESPHFETGALRENVEQSFAESLALYNARGSSPTAELRFQALAAGYGEHLFNEIARDIISADIAVFETSDHNPNVMIEMGVALTWGVRVLPIKREGRPSPPSDISGQTWTDYRDSASVFVDEDHPGKLMRMIERALQKKKQR